MISGETRLAGIIGDPVRHSLSPLLHNTAYRELGLDWRYLAFEVPDGRTAAALEAARTLGLVGLSVTMPHKTAAAAACTVITEPAARLRSVNTVTVQADGTLHGDSTDGAGFIRSLREAGVELAGTRALVLGAGGAARPVLVALADAGPDITVTVTARRPDAAAAAAALVGAATIAWTDRAEAAAAATLVVNATSVGMDDGAIPLDAGALRRGQVVADLVYHPLETALLAAARAAGAVAVDGLGMLVHQAALQVEQWSGASAPVGHMRDAARRALQEPR